MTISALLNCGVFTVFRDSLSGAYLEIPDSNWLPPPDAIPTTFLNEKDLRQAFNGIDIVIVGEAVENTKVVNTIVSDHEILAAMNEQEREIEKTKIKTKKNIPEQVTVEEINSYVSHDTDFELLKLFSSQTYRLTDKRNRGGKDYLNGMAKVILHLCPDLKEDLKSCLFAKNNKEKDDLL